MRSRRHGSTNLRRLASNSFPRRFGTLRARSLSMWETSRRRRACIRQTRIVFSGMTRDTASLAGPAAWFLSRRRRSTWYSTRGESAAISKIDVQGAEVEVLQGGAGSLPDVLGVLVE